MKRKSIIISLTMILMLLISLIGVPKSFLNKKEDILPEVKLKDIEKNKTFAIMVLDNTGKYVPYDGDEWPKDENDYFYSHSECIDNKGEKIENVIEYNEKENTALLDTSETTYCTLYFDKYNYMYVPTHTVQIDIGIQDVPNYMSEKVKNVEFVDYIKDNLKANEENTTWWDISDTSKSPAGSVIAWIEPIDDNYDTLYIGSKTKIRAVSLKNLFKVANFNGKREEPLSNLENINFNNILDTCKTTNMSEMLLGNLNLKNIKGLENWDTSKVTDMYYIFYYCASLKDISFLKDWNVSNVRRFESMFHFCSGIDNLDSLSNWQTDKVINMTRMFKECTNLRNINGIKNFNVEKVYSFLDLFYSCINLTNIDVLSNWQTTSVENMQCMFNNCVGLTNISALSQMNTEKVTNMKRVFHGCTNITDLTPINNWDVSNVNDMYLMFADDSNITNANLSKWQISGEINLYGIFRNCTNLTTIDMRNATFNQIKESTNYEYMFLNVPSSVTIIVKDTDQKNWIISNKSTLKFIGTEDNIKLPNEV